MKPVGDVVEPLPAHVVAVAPPVSRESAHVCCRILGVIAGSPLAQRLQSTVGSTGFLVFDKDRRASTDSWHRAVSGTRLQWFKTDRATAPAVPPRNHEIVLDLFGDADPAAAPRMWRITVNGSPLLRPFIGLSICRRASSIGSLLLTQRDPAGVELRLSDAHISTQLSYRALLDRFAEVAGFLLRAAFLSQPANALPVAATTIPRAPRSVAAEKLRIAAAGLAHRWRSRSASEAWAIGELRCPVQALLDGQAPSVTWIVAPDKSDNFADPFGWPGRPGVILCERYNRRSGHGKIVVVDRSGRKPARLDLGLDCHLSYPFTWTEADGRHFCLPEASEARQTNIYELGPSGSVRRHIVVDTQRAIGDPTLFHHAGRYWLAYCDADLGGHDTLCLLYADRLEGPWTPHRRNPVKIDICSARPGGTPFRIGDALFRPAQDCSITYGGALVINRVVTCTPDAYEETQAAVLRPDPNGPYPHGLHTLSLTGETLLIDGKRIMISPLILARKVAANLRRRL